MTDTATIGSNMRVLYTRDDAITASRDARALFEMMYLAAVHIELDERIAAKWWPLTTFATH